MASQALDVQTRPKEAREGPNQSKQAQQPKHPSASDRGGERYDVNPVTVKVGKPAPGS
jgi:hypothetical protein